MYMHIGMDVHMKLMEMTLIDPNSLKSKSKI